jgi:hypothetical protein
MLRIIRIHGPTAQRFMDGSSLLQLETSRDLEHQKLRLLTTRGFSIRGFRAESSNGLRVWQGGTVCGPMRRRVVGALTIRRE